MIIFSFKKNKIFDIYKSNLSSTTMVKFGSRSVNEESEQIDSVDDFIYGGISSIGVLDINVRPVTELAFVLECDILELLYDDDDVWVVEKEVEAESFKLLELDFLLKIGFKIFFPGIPDIKDLFLFNSEWVGVTTEDDFNKQSLLDDLFLGRGTACTWGNDGDAGLKCVSPESKWYAVVIVVLCSLCFHSDDEQLPVGDFRPEEIVKLLTTG